MSEFHQAGNVPAAGGAGAGAASLSVTFGHPSSAFLYRGTAPRMRVDGQEVDVGGWGTRTVAVTPGRRRVEVWVPYMFPRRVGRTRTEVEVEPGARAELEYMAPTITFGRGSLGAPGQQKSSGLSAVMVFNVVAVVAVLVVLVVVLM